MHSSELSLGSIRRCRRGTEHAREIHPVRDMNATFATVWNLGPARRPRPNENCPLRMRWASSMPEIVMAAVAERLESCHRCASPLDRAMVLLDEVLR
jgi:hypothetical protein